MMLAMMMMMMMTDIMMMITGMFIVSGLSGSVAGRHPPAGSHTLRVGVTFFLPVTPVSESLFQMMVTLQSRLGRFWDSLFNGHWPIDLLSGVKTIDWIAGGERSGQEYDFFRLFPICLCFVFKYRLLGRIRSGQEGDFFHIFLGAVHLLDSPSPPHQPLSAFGGPPLYQCIQGKYTFWYEIVMVFWLFRTEKAIIEKSWLNLSLLHTSLSLLNPF